MATLLAACSSDSTGPSTLTTTPVASVACSGATLPAAGQVINGVAGSSLCLSGGAAGAEYALIPFNGATVSEATASVTLQPSGTATVSAAALAASSSQSIPGATPLALAGRVPSRALDVRLRALERRVLTPRIAGARRWYNARTRRPGAALSIIPAAATVGQLVSLNANADDACDVSQLRTARIAAISNKAIVVADTANPPDGYTDADYQAIANRFEAVIDPTDVANFGAPSDIDGNGHVVLFFTRAVNELTPRDAGYYVGGFFFARDLFPAESSSLGDGCPTSNTAEMFYLMVPDPRGTVNGNVFSKSDVSDEVYATVAHEYQHLINASRRMYVNTASTDYEVTWLDEGLAHEAEELLFYAEAGLKPRANLDTPMLRSATTYRTAFNNDAIGNFGRFAATLHSPSTNSPYSDDDSLGTRGATWSFLRFAADHQGGSESAFWYGLVNSVSTGMGTLESVLGTDLTPIFRDWATSLLMDDVTGTDARWQQPSWNFRSIFSVLESDGSYPLQTQALTSSVPATVTLRGGTASYLRFAVSSGSAASIQWGTLPQNVQLTLVRTR
jgi:hypothetical protein